MAHVLITHEVDDYAAWKAVFDAAAPMRRAAGERAYTVLRYAEEPRRIVHFSEWTSTNDARAFFESPELVALRERAGVRSPEFAYLERLEAGVLE